MLAAGSPTQASPWRGVFGQRLRELGYVEGRDIEFLGRTANDSPEQLSILARELVRLSPDVLIAGVNTTIAVLQRATSTIPIVMVASVDPVGHGFVQSLARPGGNITGLSYLASDEMHGKLLQTLHEIVPNVSAVGLIVESGYATDRWLETAGHRLNLRIEREVVRAVDEVEQAFAALKRRRVDGITVLGGTPMAGRRHRIAELALASRMPAIAFWRDHAEAGFLCTYGPNARDLFRRSADYVDRILKGAKPSDLPVEQPTLFDFVVNLKTAKALGLTIPQSVLLRADEVIQ